MYFNSSNSSEISIFHGIIRDAIRIALGLENRLYVYDLTSHLSLERMKPHIHHDTETKDVVATESIITVREFIRLTFAALGIEIEFCGKGQLEKGVVIDIDEEQLSLLKLDKDNIKFGHTVVKVYDRNAEPPTQSPVKNDIKKGHYTIHDPKKNDVETLIKNLVMIDLEIMMK